MKKQILLLLIIISLFSLPTILAANCDVVGKSEEDFKKTEIQCEGNNCFEVQGSGKLNLEGYDSFNIKETVGIKKENSKVYCSADGKLIKGTNFAFGTKGFSESFSVNLPVKSSAKGIKIDGINPGDSIKFDTDDSFFFIKGSDNIKNIGEAGKKDLQINPVTVCGQKIDAPLGKNSFFLIKVDKDSEGGCKIVSYSIWGSEFSKEIQSSSYKCGGKDLKLNGVVLGDSKSFQCDIEGNIKCYTQGCFENMADYYNLQVEDLKLRNLQGFNSYEKVKDTGFSVIKGTDVVVDFKGAGIHCYDGECFSKGKELIYKPKSGFGIRKTGGLEFGLPGVKMFEIKPQISESAKVSPTGCFIVLERGKLFSLERDDVYKEIGCVRPTKISIPPESGRDPTIEISPTQDTSAYYDIEGAAFGIQQRSPVEEPKPLVKLKPEVSEETVVVALKCIAPKKGYNFGGPNVVCMTDDEAKEFFSKAKGELPKGAAVALKCIAPKKGYNFGGPNVVCMTDDEAKEFFSKAKGELPKDVAPGSIVFERSCSKDFVIDPLQVGCVPIKCSESKEFIPDYGCVPKEKIMPNGEVEIKGYDTQTCGVPTKLATDIIKEEGELLNKGEVRCSPEKYPNGYYVAEECIFDNSNGKYIWQVVRNAYFKDKDCGQIIEVPKVSYFRNETAYGAYLAEKAGLKGKELEIEELRSRAISSILKEKAIKKRFESILPAAPLDRKIKKDITLGEAVEKFAKENSIPPALFLGLIKTESDFDASARSSKQARGLGQLTKIAVDELNRVNKEKQFNFDEVINNPLVNLDASASYLNYLAKRLNTNVCDSRVWAAYNTGLGNLNVACCGNVNCKCTKNYWSFKNRLPEETQKHVTRVYGFSRTFAVVSKLKGC